MAPDYDKKVSESEKVSKFDNKYLKKAGGHIGRNVVQIIISNFQRNSLDNSKDKNNSPNNTNNTNYQASSKN